MTQPKTLDKDSIPKLVEAAIERMAEEKYPKRISWNAVDQEDMLASIKRDAFIAGAQAAAPLYKLLGRIEGLQAITIYTTDSSEQSHNTAEQNQVDIDMLVSMAEIALEKLLFGGEK